MNARRPAVPILVLLASAFACPFGAARAAPAPALALVTLADVDDAGRVALHAAFRSADGGRLSFWLADPHRGGTSVAFTLRRDDGSAWVPWAPTVPRAPVVGPQGSIEPLVGARQWGVTVRTRLFVRVLRTDEPAGAVPERLPPGRYDVRCDYVHPCAAVPERTADGRVVWVAEDGVFAGTVRGEPTTLAIPPPSAALRVDASVPELASAASGPIVVTVRNVGGTPVRLARRLVVAADGAAADDVDAAFEAPVAAVPGDTGAFEVAPRGSASFSADLSALVFDAHRHKVRRGPLDAMVGPALVRLEVQVQAEGGGPAVASPGLWRLVGAPARR